MTSRRAVPALLEVTFVLGSETTRAHIDWSYKVLSGAKIHKRRRYAKLPVGVDDLRWEEDGEQVLMLLKALGQVLDQLELPKAPASPRGGTTGGDPCLPLFEADPA